jgi:serine/threonine protein kinase
MTGLAKLEPDVRVGSYRIVREIGRGGMGTVYEVAHAVLPRRAALKVMHGELLKHPGMATRMVQEASILDEVRHPGIVRVFECSVLPDHRPWIAMELVPGETLAHRIHRLGKLAPEDVAALLAQVADVLAAVHARGIVHRDLKPDNILLTSSDREFPLRVIDWGVARLGPQAHLTLDGLTPGTPIYMSPEQAMGKNIGAPCDIYSLGVIAYEALCGHPPFDGRSLAEVVAMHLTSEPSRLHDKCDAPAKLCDLVHSMLLKQPSRRPVALEVRQVARAIALEVMNAEYADIEITTAPATAATVHRKWPDVVPSDEVVIVDPEALELGPTEMLPVVRKPRWTPAPARTIVPKAARDQIAGEIELKH